MSTKNQVIDKAIKDHDKAISDIQVALNALMKPQEQSIKQQEQLLKHAIGGSFLRGSPSNDIMDPKTNRPMRIEKVKFPCFSGMDVEAWIYRCEHFLPIDKTPETMKLRYAVIHLEGDMIQWHQAFMKTSGATVEELSWTDYARAISTRFSNAMFKDPMEEIDFL
nr:hypothetical protein [Tanacetum cinerariifolium]